MALVFPNPNIFALYPLDRASNRRTDAAWLAERLKDANTLVLPVWRQKPMLTKSAKGTELNLMRPGLAERLMGGGAVTVFLGCDKAGAYFACDISAANDPEQSGPLAGLGFFKDMRAAAMELPAGDAAIAGTAKALIDWHQRHGFCANCGARTDAAEAGWKRVCPSCKAEHFPRTDPVAIMLATDGDKCLLGRGKQFPPGMYSALAGFIEPGESIEEAVAREIKEETGVSVALDSVRYHSTQPWPFPSSLMIGCLARATDTRITIDETEMADARWFSRDEITAALAAGGRGQGFFVPPHFAIAHQLIKTWAEEKN